MKDLLGVINRYLTKATQHAIQITGPWGSGKTFCYFNTILPIIMNRTTYFDAKRKYVPVYVSLFGLKTVEEIQVKILLEIITYQTAGKTTVNPKNLRITANLFKILLQGALSLFKLGQLKEYGSIVQDIGKNVLDPHQLVICFDDIERKNAELSADNFIGYANTLIDAGTKVFLICNEDKIDEKHYKDYKEKIIGTTVIYQPDVTQVLSEIIKGRYNDPLQKFLLVHIRHIAEIVKYNNNNYRHLIYALDCFQDVFSQIHLSIIDTHEIFSDKCKEHLPDIFRFSIGVAMEFKKDSISYEDYKFFKGINQPIPGIDRSATKFFEREESLLLKKREFVNDFVGKYFSIQGDYKFYGSIFSFVSGAKDFDVKQFENEFNYNYHLSDGNILPQYQVLSDLDEESCLLMTDEDYHKMTTKMLSFAEMGGYLLHEYERIYEYAFRFNNVLNFKQEEIVQQLKTGMEAHMSRQKDTKAATDSLMSYAVDSEIARELKDFGFQLVEKFTLVQDEQKMHDLMYRLSDNITAFQEQYENNSDFKTLVKSVPFLYLADAKKMALTIKNANAKEILFLRRFFRERYTTTNNIEREFENLKTICWEISSSISDKSSGLKVYQLNFMLQELKGYNPNLLEDIAPNGLSPEKLEPER